MPEKLKRWLLSVSLGLVGVFCWIKPAGAVTATGSWSASDIIQQSGSLSLNIPAKGGTVDGTFSGGGGKLFQYGGRFTGSFSGGWNGSMNGSFSGWASASWTNPSTGQEERSNNDIYGSWSGRLNPDGTGTAWFDNQAKYGLAGSVRLHYSVEQFEKEYGGKAEAEASESPVSSPTTSPLPSPSPSPSPSPQPRIMNLVGLDGKVITSGQVRIRMKDGTIVTQDLTNGQISFDKSQVASITVKTDDGKQINLTDNGLDSSQVVMGDWEQWKTDIKTKLQRLATILNGGKEVNLDDHFKIDWDGEDNFYQPPAFDFLRWFGAKDKISFYSGYITVNGDVDTPVHEALGHGLTEVIGEGNKLEYAGGPHDDPWQPTYNKRSGFNPLTWFGGDKVVAVDDEQARGFAMSEGWAQYVGDKWQRELTQTADEESDYTEENAREKMEQSRNGDYGKLYADEPGYGAKVENVVATAFNELYKGQDLEEAVRDFQAVREEYKKNNNGKSFQNVNEYLDQKAKMTDDPAVKQRIEELKQSLDL